MSNQIRVAKSGKNVLTSTDPNDFIYDSSYNTFKIIETGTQDFTITGVAAREYERTISHSVGNASSFVLFVQFSDGKTTFVLDGNSVSFSGTSVEGYVRAANISSSVITFTVYKPYADAMSINVRYYIFETPL